jgi:threonine dehydratase
MLTSRAETFAGGLAADYPGELALEAMMQYVDDMILVSDKELYRAMGHILEETGQLVEGAGAAAVAAMGLQAARWEGQTVVTLLSGANLDPTEISAALDASFTSRSM